MMAAAWTPARQLEAVRMYQSGKTLVEVSTAMKLGGTAVLQKYLKLHRVSMRSAARRGWPQDKIDECLRLHSAGMTQVKIAEYLNTAQSQVYAVLKKNGVPFRRIW